MGTSAEALDLVLTAIDARDAWAEFDIKARREEGTYFAAAMALFRAERHHIAARVEDATGTKGLDDPVLEIVLLRIAADYAPGGAYHQAWLERYRALIGRTMTVSARAVSAQVGISFSLDNPRARDAVLRRVNRLTGHVTETTLERVREVIRGGMADHVGVTEIARRVREDAFGDTITRARAKTIAQTESVGALNEGSYLGATASGVMQSKRWLDQDDGRVRESHQLAAADGWIGITERFSNGLLYPHEPGAPAEEVIQCRCSTAFSDLPAAEANRQ